jgi:hypothetical protein
VNTVPAVYKINPHATATATLATTITGAVPALVGAEFLNGELWISSMYARPDYVLGKVELTTGAYTVVKRTPGYANWQGLAANEDTDTLYTIEVSTAGDPLYSLTTAGVLTFIGFTNADLRGLAFDNGTDTLYGVDGMKLYRVDTTTAATAVIGTHGLSTVGNVGLAYAPSLSSLYLTWNTQLWRLNPWTAQATLVGTIPRDLTGLAFQEDVLGAAVADPAREVLLAITRPASRPLPPGRRGSR